MAESSVAEIHGYPRRPPGFEEQLFPTVESKRRMDLPRGVGESVRAIREPVRLRGVGSRVEVVRSGGCRGGSTRRRVLKVLERWREVRAWWDEEAHTDRLVFRVLLAGGAVADLALERSRGWFLVGVVD